jgi:protein SCO1/2
MAERNDVRAQGLWRGAAVIGGGLLIATAAWVVFSHGVERTDSALPIMGTVPEFSLRSSTGQPLSQANLSGRIWIADFMFTHCPSICPTLSAHMAKLQSALTRQGLDVRLVSFTVDPVNDTPEVLRAYGERFHADPSRWLFVTGERDALYRLIGDGFHLAVAERSPGANSDGEGLITHSDRFVLVDGDLRIRGYYHGTEAESVQQLLNDVHRLQGEAAAARDPKA